MNTISATSRSGPMTFQAKSNLAMGAILTTVYGVFGGLALTVLDADVFWIAQALLGALVLSEITKSACAAMAHHRTQRRLMSRAAWTAALRSPTPSLR